MNYRNGKHTFEILSGIFFLILVFMPVRAQAAEKITGGATQETAVEISLDKDYEAEISLEEQNGVYYFGEAWYKVRIPEFAHYVGLATENAEAAEGTLYSICNDEYDLKDIYYDSYESVASALDDRYRVAYYYLDNEETYCYIHAWSYSPAGSSFRVVAGIHPLEEENVSFQLNQEYNEKFYFYSSSNSEICTSTYSFVAPYTGRYRIICNSKNGDANCELVYYTGQQAGNVYCEKNRSTSKIVNLKEGIKYLVCFSGRKINSAKPAEASFYISSAPIEAINLEKTKITLNKAEQYQINPQVVPEKAVNPKVTYHTSNNKVAKVSKNGCITAVGGGKAVITVDSTDGSGVQATIQVTVKPKKVTRLDLNISKLVLSKKTQKIPMIKAKTYPSDADNGTVTFKSSNSKIVAVDKKTGRLYPKKAGTVIITCVTNDGSKLKKTCKVIVKKSYFK